MILLQSVCADPEGGLFRVLDTTWRFSSSPGRSSLLPFLRSIYHNPLGDDSINTCRIHFDLSFEFRNSTHARITHLFFDKVFIISPFPYSSYLLLLRQFNSKYRPFSIELVPYMALPLDLLPLLRYSDMRHRRNSFSRWNIHISSHSFQLSCHGINAFILIKLEH